MARHALDTGTGGELPVTESAPRKEPERASVPVVQHPLPSGEFRENYLLRRRPVMIRAGDLKQLGWRTDRWTPDYLIQRVGSRPVDVQVRQGGVFSPVGPGSHKRMAFDEFVRRVMEGEETTESLYLNLQGYERQLGPPLLQLLGDFTLPVYFRDAEIRWINLWMGRTAGTTQSQMHHDYHDNLYCVVSGAKRFVVFPPSDAPNLYTRARPVRIDPNGVIHYAPQDRDRDPHFSMIRTDRVDHRRFPNYAHTHPREARIEAGDLLFLPAGWFHEVHSEGTHMAINFWADPPPSERVRPDY